MKTYLDRRTGVLTLVHLREKADSRVVLIFRIKETPAVQVLSFVASVTSFILENVSEETEHAILADK